MYNIYQAHYSQFNMLWRAMYEQQCAMHTLYNGFANVCKSLCTICAVPVLATVKSNFNMYTGFQLKTNKHSIHSHSRHSFPG